MNRFRRDLGAGCIARSIGLAAFAFATAAPASSPGLAAVPPAPHPVLRVATVAELFQAIGSDRVIELAPGEYDLAALAPRKDSIVVVESPGSALITVRGVRGMAIRGSSEARIFASHSRSLAFEDDHDLELSGLRFEIPDAAPGRVEPYQEMLNLIFRSCPGVRLDHCSLPGRQAGELMAVSCPGFTLNEVSLSQPYGEFPLLFQSSGEVLVSGGRWRGARFKAAGGTRLHVEGVTLLGEFMADARLEDVLRATPDSRIVATRVRHVDAMTGQVRRGADAPRELESEQPQGRTFDEVPMTVALGGVRHDVPDEEDAREITLRADGRAVHVPGLDWLASWEDSSSFRTRRLGGPSGPLLVTWRSLPQGSGSYQQFSYALLSARRPAEALLAGTIPSNGAGGGAADHRDIEFALDGEFLAVRIVESHTSMGPEGGPGCRIWWIQDAYTTYDCRHLTAFENVYRVRGDSLEPFRFEEFAQLGAGERAADLLERGFRPTWGGPRDPSPLAGDWFRRSRSPAEGERLVPRPGSIARTMME